MDRGSCVRLHAHVTDSDRLGGLSKVVAQGGLPSRVLDLSAPRAELGRVRPSAAAVTKGGTRLGTRSREGQVPWTGGLSTPSGPLPGSAQARPRTMGPCRHLSYVQGTSPNSPKQLWGRQRALYSFGSFDPGEF